MQRDYYLKRCLIILMILGCVWAVPAWGAPNLVNYQGVLTDSGGNPLTGSYNFEFSVYDALSAGNKLWSETQSGVQVDNGIYNVFLGSGTTTLGAFNPDLFSANTRWLEVTAGGETFSPRIRITSTAFSLKAQDADTVDGIHASALEESAEIDTDIATHAGIPGAHHTKTSSFTELSDTATDAQIPNNITIDQAANADTVDGVHAGNSSGQVPISNGTLNTNLNADMVDGLHAADLGGGGGVPSGYIILGETPTAPTGYTYTGRTLSENNPGAWSTKSSLPSMRSAPGSAVVNGKIYIIGGYYYGYKTTNEEYDPATNSWTTKTSMPTARYYLSCASVNGKIYAIGGENGSSLSTNEEYDPIINSWVTKTSMPTARSLCSASAVNGKIYVIGGIPSPPNEEYDPTTDYWTVKTSPGSIYRNCSGVVNNKIYVIAASNKKVKEYDPATNSWTTKTSVLPNRGVPSCTSVNNKIYATGGDFDVSTNAEYDPVSDSWTTKSPMPTGRYEHSCEAVNGKIYAIGGVKPGGFLSANEVYDPAAERTYYLHRKD